MYKHYDCHTRGSYSQFCLWLRPGYRSTLVMLMERSRYVCMYAYVVPVDILLVLLAAYLRFVKYVNY